jgi:hypothetical protein
MRVSYPTVSTFLVLIVALGLVAGRGERLGLVPGSSSPGAGEASITVSPESGPPGSSITVSGSGFAPQEPVAFRWQPGDTLPFSSTEADASGAYSAQVEVPDLPSGEHHIFARGSESYLEATAEFAVTGADNRSGMVGEGTYDVYATRIGLVGGTTSSGHLVHEDDLFVALPACTPTNCPNGASWGHMTDCKEKCYVKVINPISGICRVEPILDLGPWFRVDDWWSPTEKRYLNNLPDRAPGLEQGQPAAEAALTGEDVGYGRGPNGVGNDDTGSQGTRPVREVGNRAAIDLADGTWRALDLESDGTGANVRVELLWQTGDDPGVEAKACGHPIDQPAPTHSPALPGPSFEGGPLSPVASSESQNGSGAQHVHDGNVETTWSTIAKTPAEGWFTLDFGESTSLSGIRWKFSETGNADSMTIEISVDGTVWSTVGTFGNANTEEWRGTPVEQQARFVRFSFVNPHGDVTLGSIAEIELWSPDGVVPTPGATPASTPIAGSNPSFEGAALPIASSSSTPNTSGAHRALDGNQMTSWYTVSTSTPPGPASITFDLGDVRTLTGVRWMYRVAGGADQARLQVSTDGVEWTQLVTTSNRIPGTWEGWETDVDARYVRIVFDNPDDAPTLGYLAELEVWGVVPAP